MFNITNLVFYYPTTVIIVDDNEEYLETLLNGLKEKNIKCMGFSSSKEALSYIYSHPNQYYFSQALKEIEDDSPQSHTIANLRLDLSRIYKETLNIKNRDEISVIILDQQMPDIPGDQFASIITDGHIKKLMLTGQLNDQKAIELLNAAIIDSYVEKKITNGIGIIYEKIIALQYRYFEDLNKHFNKIIREKNDILNHPAYKKSLTKLLKNIKSLNNIFCQKMAAGFLSIEMEKKYGLSSRKNLILKDGSKQHHYMKRMTKLFRC